MKKVNVWDRYELALKADVSKLHNPFTQVSLIAYVTGNDEETKLYGFYDGDGVFRVRFMPKETGLYHIVTSSNLPELDKREDDFEAIPAKSGRHGVADIAGTRFRYRDGTPLFVMGTTAYVWHLRPADVRERSLESFSKYGFNKIRMLFFPKQYSGGFGQIDVSYEPPCYPFEGQPKAFDFTRPNPEYFRQFEKRLLELEERDIFADVILFHPYDSGHWDIDTGMGEDDALFYVRYLVSRIASHANVWFSLANEYDIKIDHNRKWGIATDGRDWDVIGETIRARDPYRHPISCHNITFGKIYPDRPWMTHVSYQHPDTYALMLELRQAYQKPVIDDEYQYEGNLKDEWGNSTAEMELDRHWRSVMAGGYATHGEVFLREGNNRDLFWAYGGTMTGQSAPRLKFLREIVQACPIDEMERDWIGTDSEHYYTLHQGSDFYLVYMRDTIPGKGCWIGDRLSRDFDETRYEATFYDVWNCRVVRCETVSPGKMLPLTAWTVVALKKIK